MLVDSPLKLLSHLLDFLAYIINQLSTPFDLVQLQPVSVRVIFDCSHAFDEVF